MLTKQAHQSPKSLSTIESAASKNKLQMLTQNAPSESTAKKVELTKKQPNVVIMPIEEVKKPKDAVVKSSSPSVKQKSLKNATSQLKSYL